MVINLKLLTLLFIPINTEESSSVSKVKLVSLLFTQAEEFLFTAKPHPMENEKIQMSQILNVHSLRKNNYYRLCSAIIYLST